MTTNCPSCGNPLRPGSRFCGNCGNVLPAKPVGGPSQAGGATCPHCKQPLRQGAKFCNSCGKSTVVAPPPVPVPSTPPQVIEKPVAVSPPQAPEPTMPAGSAVQKPSRKKTWIWLGVTLAVLCVVVVSVGGYLYIEDPFNWRTTATSQLSPEVILTETTAPEILHTATETLPVQETATPTLVTPTFTQEVVTETSTATLTPTEGQPQGQVEEIWLLEEFTQTLTLTSNWFLWGEQNKPKVDKEGYLSLINDIEITGVNSNSVITLTPGVNIEFIAKLNFNFAVLNFDWSAIERRDQPTRETSLVQLRILFGKISVFSIIGNYVCEQPFDIGAINHTYLIRVREDMAVEILIDGEQSICLIPNAGPSMPARITFSGLGAVDNIKVTRR